ncbi:MAG TPA: hypothetical protein VM597_02800 [Gemmataceae bacterium]|nr:hypothetical protein [Gemmataceae bacterium]
MITSATLEDRPPSESDDTVEDRLRRLEGEVADLRHTLSDLADIVVGDIKERREVAAAVSAPIPEVPIPASLVPGGETTLAVVGAARRPWLVFDLLKEIGTTAKMYMDPRYRVRRSTQLIVPVLVGMMVADYLLFRGLFLEVPVVTPVLEHLIGGLLAVLLYKVLSREVARYRQVLVQYTTTTRALRSAPTVIVKPPDGAAHSRQDMG